MPFQPIDLESLLKVPYVDPYGGFEVSAVKDGGGGRAVFSWNRDGRWEIYFALFSDEGHMENVVAAETRRISFLAKYLE